MKTLNQLKKLGRNYYILFIIDDSNSMHSPLNKKHFL